EPVHTLISREILVPTGVTFTSGRAPDEQKSEFLASADPWFTPTIIRTGPDGAIWVADMYRWVIEHPNWIPKDLVKRIDVRAGADKGRIYRIYPSDKKPRPIPHLDKLDIAGLVAALDSPNGWQRDTAQRLLVQRKDKAAIPLLEKQARQSLRPLCRLHSLCTLDGLSGLTQATLLHALEDPHPGVRKHAVRFCEPRLGKKSELDGAITDMVGDPDPQLRLQVAYALGLSGDSVVGVALLHLMEGEPLVTAAAMSSVTPRNLQNVVSEFSRVMAEKRRAAPPADVMEGLLRSAAGFKKYACIGTILTKLAAADAGQHTAWQLTVLAGWLDALDQQNTSLLELAKRDARLQAAVRSLNPIFERARASVTGGKSASEEKLLAIRLLGRGLSSQDKDLTTLAGLLTPQTSSDLQAAAVNALGHFRGDQVPQKLLGGWKSYGPALRNEVLDVLSRREEWLSAVLNGLEQKQILAMEIDTPRRQRFLEHKSEAVRRRAGKLFADLISPDRQKVVAAYKSVLSLKGDVERGKQVFTKNCAVCHRVAGIGQQVGPDLAVNRDKETA